MTKSNACAMLSVAVVVMAGTASAAIIDGFGAPSSVVTGGTTETFDASSSGLYASVTFGNVTISGVDGDYTIGGDYNGGFNTSGGQSIYNDEDFLPGLFRFDFATAVNAFAFNFGASNSSWALNAYDIFGAHLEGFVLRETGFSNDGDYFGLSSTMGISYATLIGDPGFGGDYVFIDNFTSSFVTPVAPVPLPASLPLLMGAFVSLAWLRRSRRAAR